MLKSSNKPLEFKLHIDRDVYTTLHKCLTGKAILELAGKIPVDQYQLYQKLQSNKMEKISCDETVCFDDPGIEKFTTQKKKHQDGQHISYKLQVDRELLETSHRCLTGRDILELAGKKPHSEFQLYKKLKNEKVEKVAYDETVCFDDHGIEKFTTQKKKKQDGQHISYKLQVDRELLETSHRCLTGRDILELAGKKPHSEFQLYKKLKNEKVEKIAYDETVCFDDPGIEKFTTQKKKHQDGELRRNFKLLAEDAAYLEAMGFEWETIVDANLNYLILKGVLLPLGYNVSEADIAIRFDTGYPRTQLDMAFFFPKLCRKDNQSINNLADIQIDGMIFQQWSRHRTPDNPWLEGIDCLATHIGFIEQWLEDEFKRKPYVSA